MNKRKEKSITINAILNVLKVGLGIVFSIATFPYASRVLQVVNMGKVNYAYSVVSYFSLFAAMGISKYAVREGTKYRNDRKEFDAFSGEVFSLNIVTTVIAYAVMFVMLLTFAKFHDYTNVILLQSLSILFATVGVEWLNTIYEDYLYITVRSIVVQTITFLMLILLVKKPEDYLIYAALNVISNGIICVANLIHCRKYTTLRIRFSSKMFKHLKPMIVFFSSNLAVTIYVSADTTMIGWMIGDYSTGLYSVSVKIYQFVKQLMSAIYVVTIPRLTEYAERKDFEEFRKLLTNIGSILLLILVPSGVGMIVLAKSIILIVAGASYVEATRSLQLLGISLIFAVGSGFMVNCVNTPLGKEVISLKATIAAAVINIVLNLYFIPAMQQDGAAITTIISEGSVILICVLMFRNIRNILQLGVLLKQALYAGAGCVWIVVLDRIVRFMIHSDVWAVIAVFAGSIVGYLAILTAGQNPYAKEALIILKKKIRH